MSRRVVLLGTAIAVLILVISVLSCFLGYAAMGRALSTPTPTPIVVNIEEMRRVAELATVRYTLSTAVVGSHVPNDLRRALGIKEELVLVAYGEVVAGFDLHKLSDDDVWVEGNRVQLRLPPPQVLYVRLDNERTRVVYYKKSWLIDRDLNLEGKARQEAEELIRQAALESGLLEQAGEYGRLFFTEHLRSLGFQDVRVIVR